MRSTETPAGPRELRFPFTPPTLLDPPQEFAALRAEQPVARVALPTGDEAWLVTRYEDVRVVLADPRFSRAAATAPGAPRLRPVPPDRTSIMSLDPPAHSRLRRLVAGAFATGPINALRPRVQQLTDDLLTAMAAGPRPADLVSQLAAPLAVTVICELLGVPAADRRQFRSWTDTILSLDMGRRPDIAAARTALLDYLAALVAAKRQAPAADVLSLLIAARDDGDRLSEDELLTFGSTLLTAGYHTVVTGIANGALSLLRTPDAVARMRREPELCQVAVEEVLRHTPGAASGGTIRVALEDVELGGVTVRAGEAVIPAISSANRDVGVFAEPDRFVVDRSDNHHLAFGHGIHHCLGARLARMELRIALGTLARRFPDIRLGVPEDQLDWGGSSMIRGLRSLPVVW